MQSFCRSMGEKSKIDATAKRINIHDIQMLFHIQKAMWKAETASMVSRLSPLAKTQTPSFAFTLRFELSQFFAKQLLCTRMALSASLDANVFIQTIVTHFCRKSTNRKQFLLSIADL